MADSIAVYTAISGGRDELRIDQCFEGADFFAFVDLHAETGAIDSGWTLMPVCDLFHDHRRNAKIHKALSHLYLPRYRYILWIDGSVSLRVPAEMLVEKYLAHHDMAMFRHRWQKCAYKEAADCIRLRLDREERIREQVDALDNRGWPIRAGQHEGTVVLRRHTPAVMQFNTLWWAEISRFSKRDQISLEWAASAAGVQIADMLGNVQQNDYFHRRPHARKM